MVGKTIYALDQDGLLDLAVLLVFCLNILLLVLLKRFCLFVFGFSHCFWFLDFLRKDRSQTHWSV